MSDQSTHEKIQSQQQPILSLVYKAEQLTENYQEELTPEQVTQLTTQASLLKATLEKVCTPFYHHYVFIPHSLLLLPNHP